jgi:DNA-binding response OmpR family regulator
MSEVLKGGEVLEGSKGRILLVGGDPDVARTFQVYLDAHHFSVQMVSRSDEALAACRRSSPDAVVFTLDLADLEGCRLCRQIRAGERAGHIFILALLPTDDRDARLNALAAGSDEVMVYPIDIEAVRMRIEGVLGKRDHLHANESSQC